jgi:hypothetical protein
MILKKLKKPYILVLVWLLFSLVSLAYFGYQNTIFGAVCA